MLKKLSNSLAQSNDGPTISVDEQQRKLEKYEKRLRDMIVAYRSVCEERDTLKEVVSSFTDPSESVEKEHDKSTADDRYECVGLVK